MYCVEDKQHHTEICACILDQKLSSEKQYSFDWVIRATFLLLIAEDYMTDIL